MKNVKLTQEQQIQYKKLIVQEIEKLDLPQIPGIERKDKKKNLTERDYNSASPSQIKRSQARVRRSPPLILRETQAENLGVHILGTQSPGTQLNKINMTPSDYSISTKKTNKSTDNYGFQSSRFPYTNYEQETLPHLFQFRDYENSFNAINKEKNKISKIIKDRRMIYYEERVKKYYYPIQDQASLTERQIRINKLQEPQKKQKIQKVSLNELVPVQITTFHYVHK